MAALRHNAPGVAKYIRMKTLAVVVLCVLFARAFCRPNGAPAEACSQLIPQHPTSVPLQGSGPFTLDVPIPSVGYDPSNGYERMHD